jgi:uncharacterized protein YdgA (DUF945 family)
MSKAAAVAVAAVVGVTGVTLGSFAWAGGAALGQLRAQTAQLSTVSPAIKIVDEKVERGLFHSSYEVKVRFGCMPVLPQVPGGPVLTGSEGEPLELAVHTEVRHGPLLPQGLGFASLDSTLVVPEKWRARVDALTHEQPPLRVVTAIGFDRGFRSEFTIPALTFSDPQAGSFETDVLRGKLSGDAYDSAHGGTYQLDMPGFGLRSRAPDTTLEVKVGSMQSQTKLGPHADPAHWLVDSHGSGSIANLSFTGSAASALGGTPTPFKMSFSALKFTADSKLDKGLYSSSVAYGGQGSFNDFKIDRVELKAGLRRLDAAGYQKLLSHLFEVAFSCEPEVRKGGLEAQFPALEREAVALMVHDPEYALDSLAIELGGQRGELSYALGTEGVKPDDLQRALLDLAMEHGVLRAHARVQLGLLDAIDRQLAAGSASAPAGSGPLRSMADFALVQFGDAGYLVQKGDALETSLSYKNGKLELNGKAPVLPDLGNLLGP